MLYLMLFSQQHRGQESCGITVEGKRAEKRIGLVAEGFHNPDVSQILPGNRGVAHVRYATQGSVSLENAGPFRRKTSFGEIVLTHNGHLVNYADVRRFLESKGIGFDGTCDGELEVKLIVWKAEQNGHDMIGAIRYAMKKLVGSYSIVLMAPDGMYGFRDHHGYRPMSVARKNGSYYFASETCAFDMVGAQFLRDVKPGEIVYVQKQKLLSCTGRQCTKCAFCIFELIYFALPTSVVFGIPVWEFQQRMGMRMAELFRPQLDALLGAHRREDIVICPVPDTARDATWSFARSLGMEDRHEEAIIRSHYAGRTFINSGQVIRDFKVRLKFSLKKDLIRGKIVIILDDSIVRGSTTRKLVRMLKKFGAKEVHVVIYSPQIIGPCFMGIDTPTSGELIAYTEGAPAKVATYLCAESLLHPVIADLGVVIESFGKRARDFCFACFSRDYALSIPPENLK